MKNSFLVTDKHLFTISPSNWINIGWFIAAVVSTALNLYLGVFFGLIWLWKCLVVFCFQYQFAEYTMTEKRGVLNIRIQEVHYFRIKSIRMEEPLLYRLVGICSIDLITSDPLIPVIRILAIENGTELRNFLKTQTAQRRKEQGVMEYDLR